MPRAPDLYGRGVSRCPRYFAQKARSGLSAAFHPPASGPIPGRLWKAKPRVNDMQMINRGSSPTDRARPLPDDPTLAVRLEAKLDRSGGSSSCWPFVGKCQNGGYGVLHTGGSRGRTVYAHRVAWAIANGRDPGRMAVCHRCDNPPCCNPAHLFLGTIGDNSRDMVAKGRHRGGPPPGLRGERIGSSKLTADKVREIRRRSAAGEGSGALGRIYGVDSSSIRQIVRRETWAHVTDGGEA